MRCTTTYDCGSAQRRKSEGVAKKRKKRMSTHTHTQKYVSIKEEKRYEQGSSVFPFSTVLPFPIPPNPISSARNGATYEAVLAKLAALVEAKVEAEEKDCSGLV